MSVQFFLESEQFTFYLFIYFLFGTHICQNMHLFIFVVQFFQIFYAFMAILVHKFAQMYRQLNFDLKKNLPF